MRTFQVKFAKMAVRVSK